MADATAYYIVAMVIRAPHMCMCIISETLISCYGYSCRVMGYKGDPTLAKCTLP